MNGYYEPVTKLLREAGWHLLRQGKGSHQIWCDKDGKRRVTVPFGCKSKQTANSILRDAGIRYRF